MTDEPELKDNLCVVNFICFEQKRGDCVHHRNKKRCKFFDDYTCKDPVAQVQAMSRYLKHIGLELSAPGLSKVNTEKAKAEFLNYCKTQTVQNWIDHENLQNKFTEFCNKLGL